MESQEAGSQWLVGFGKTTIDEAKGRFLVPQRVREQLGNTFVLTVGPLGCLQAFTFAFWDQKCSMIMSARPTNPARARLARQVMGNAEHVSFDSSGRAVVPSHLREKVKFNTNVVIIGVGDCYEIWPAEEYELFQRNPEAYKANWTDSYNEALEALDNETAAREARA